MTNKPDEKWKATYAMIGKRLRWAREVIYPSQAEFARALDVDKSTVNKIERGDRGLTIMTLILAANKLRTGADFLLHGELALVEPSLRAKLVKRHPELLDAPQLPTKAPRRVFEPIWPQPPDADVLAAPDGIDTSDPAPPGSRRAVRTD